MGVRESVADIGRLFSRYLDGIVIRTFAHEEVAELARYATIPVINGLTDLHHPCQILGRPPDHSGKIRPLRGGEAGRVGDGNNVAHSWLQGAAKMSRHLALACPEGVLAAGGAHPQAPGRSRGHGGSVEIMEDPFQAVRGRMSSIPTCGSAWARRRSDAERLEVFQSYQVNQKLLAGGQADDAGDALPTRAPRRRDHRRGHRRPPIDRLRPCGKPLAHAKGRAALSTAQRGSTVNMTWTEA